MLDRIAIRRGGLNAPLIVFAGYPAMLADQCRQMCLSEHWQMVEATTLRELYGVVEHGVVSVIVLPSSIDGTSAREVVETLRRKSARYVPLVGFLSLETAADHAEALLSGFDVYLTSSSGLEALKRQVTAMIGVAAKVHLATYGPGAMDRGYGGPLRRRTDLGLWQRGGDE